MYVGRDFDPEDVGENEVFTLDFVNDLASGETITSAVWKCEVKSGSDSQAASRLSGAPSNSGTKSSQRVAGLLTGVTYRLTAVVTTSLSNVISLWSHVACQTPD